MSYRCSLRSVRTRREARPGREHTAGRAPHTPAHTCGLWESPTWAGVNMCKQPLALALPSFGFIGADAIKEAFKLEDVTPTG